MYLSGLIFFPFVIEAGRNPSGVPVRSLIFAAAPGDRAAGAWSPAA